MRHGWCQYSPKCRFKHVRGSANGPLSHLSAAAITMGPSFELPADIIPAGFEEADADGAADAERDIAVKAAVSCGLCEEGATDFEDFLQEQGF